MNSRRKFLQAVAIAPALAAGCTNLNSSKRPLVRGRRSGQPNKIIHMVADGMSAGMLSCGNHFSEATRSKPLTFFTITKRPGSHVGFMDMRSQNSIVTDSSAASSVWGSGVRIPNGKVNMASDGQKLVTLYELMEGEGWKRGLVTTTEITHATPAGFAACTASRDYADEIAAQYLDRRIDVLMGGGRKFYTADKRKDKRDLLADYRAAGYAVLQTPEDLRSLGSSSRVLGVFSDSHIPYLVDQVGGVVKPAPTPSLAAMTRAALAQFQRDDNFILQVEGGKVDHGCHSMDIAAAVRELISFDEAIDVALQFQAEHPDTVIVMTTDHATGNPGLNGMGSGYRDSGKLFANIAKIKCSIGEIAKTMKKGKTVEEMAARLKEVTGYEPSSKKLEMLKPFLDDKGVALYDVYKSENAGLSQVLSNYTGVSFTSGNHTSDLIPIVACGPGSEAFQGLVQGPDIFFRYTEFAGIRFKNPQEALVNLAEASGGTENVEEYWQAVA